MALVTVAQLQQHVDTDLSDDAITRLLADADAEIVRRYGPHTSANTEVLRPAPGRIRLYVRRKISTITSVTETTVGVAGEEDVVLSANDYEIESNRVIRRKQGGDNSASCWAPLVSVVYTPVSDSDRRIRVTIDLVRLAAKYIATSSEKAGDVSLSSVNYAREREELLRVLAPSIAGSFA